MVTNKLSTSLTVLLFRVALASTLLHTTSGCDTNPKEEHQASELKMVVSGTNAGWMLSFTGLASEPKNMRVRVGNDGEFRNIRRPVMPLPAGSTAAEITVYYTVDGVENGPVVFQFQPLSEALEQSKDTLDMTRTQWVSWRRHVGNNLVYFSHINMHSCALKRVEYGFSDSTNMDWDLPPCRTSGKLGRSDKISLTAPADAKTISVRLTFIDGEKTPVEHFPIDDDVEAQAAAEALQVAETAKRFEPAMAKVVALRDRGENDYSACGDLERLGREIGEDEAAQAKTLCRETKASESVEAAISKARANAGAGESDMPYECGMALRELKPLGTTWAKKKKSEVLTSCYEDLGLVIMQAKVPDMKYCDFRVKELYKAVKEHKIDSEQLNLWMAKADPLCATGH